ARRPRLPAEGGRPRPEPRRELEVLGREGAPLRGGSPAGRRAPHDPQAGDAVESPGVPADRERRRVPSRGGTARDPVSRQDRESGRSTAAESLYAGLPSLVGGEALALASRGWQAARAGRLEEAE